MNDKEKSSSNVFNMSLATLERIDILLRKLEEYNINGGIIHIQRILLILYKEIYPFLDYKEKKYGDVIYEVIGNGAWVEGDQVVYNPKVIPVITSFDFWIRQKLFEKGLLMNQSDHPETALSNL